MKSLKSIFTKMLLYQTYGLLYLSYFLGYFWGQQHSPAATLTCHFDSQHNCETWKGEKNKLFFMLMAFMILNWITEKKLENRLSKVKNTEAQKQAALESYKPFTNGNLQK